MGPILLVRYQIAGFTAYERTEYSSWSGNENCCDTDGSEIGGVNEWYQDQAYKRMLLGDVTRFQLFVRNGG